MAQAKAEGLGRVERANDLRHYLPVRRLFPIGSPRDGDLFVLAEGASEPSPVLRVRHDALLTAVRVAPSLGRYLAWVVAMAWGRQEGTEAEARATAHAWWPTAALKGEVSQELPNPKQFTDLVSIVTEDQVAEAISCGPDAAVHLDKIRAYIDAGYDHVYLHQVGPDQRGFIDFARAELLPELTRQPVARSGAGR